MIFGRRGSRVASLSDSFVRCLGRGGIAVLVLGILATLSVAGDRSAEMHGPLRAVRSSLTPRERVITLSTSSLYARNDPWKSYLASDSTCPGGERTDLPIARQVATVACLINYARKRAGVRALVVRRVLNGASIAKARAIVRCSIFAHNPCGGDWKTAVRSTGYRGGFGENLYIATGRWGAPRVAVDAWLNSAAHRENLFSQQWREQGLALLVKPSFDGYRDVSLWVSVLGDG